MSEKIAFSFKNYFPALLFALLVLIDFFQGQWEFFNGKNEIIWLIGFKGLTLLFLVLMTVKSDPKLLMVIGLLGISSLIGYGKNMLDFEMIKMWIKYLSPFIYFFGFKSLLQHPKQLKIMQYAILGIIYLGVVSILMGYVFDLQSFRTYYYRFGYKGLFKRSIDASYFIMFAGIFIYAIKDQLKQVWIPAALLLMSTFFIGTKLPLLFLGLAGIILLSTYRIKSKKQLKIGVGIFVGLAVGTFLFLNKLVDETYQLFYDIYSEKGLWSSLTSFRSDLLVEAFQFYREEWTWRNYLFGGKNFEHALVEMSIPDLLIFFGFIGTLIYLFYYLHIYLQISQGVSRKLLLTVLFCSLLGGQFFFNQTVSLWFGVLFVFLQSSQHKKF